MTDQLIPASEISAGGVFPADPVAAARALEPLVAAGRDEMDAQRRLTPEIVEALRDLGAFRMGVPLELGGPEWDPVTQVRVVEELSRLDGSVGWCTMIAAAGSFVSGFLERDVAQRWFGPREACLAGQLAPTGRADVVPGGYRVSGRFRFASGSGHCSLMIAGCLLYDGEELVRNAKGRPEMRSVIFPPSDCTIIDTWHTTGLWATGSNDYELDDVFVAEENTWDPAGPMRRREPLYRYPPLFLVVHAGVPLGIGRRAIDTVLELAADKSMYAGSPRPDGGPKLRDDGQAQEAIAVAEAQLAAASAFTYATVRELWEVLCAGDRVSPRMRAMYRIMMTWVHQTAKEVVESMYDIASTSSIYRGGALDRQMRDILTACQHRMVHPKLYRPTGRLLVGLDSGDPLV
jgi:alkylation response protein AidB-like acyl-CoA dehydrogenase